MSAQLRVIWEGTAPGLEQKRLSLLAFGPALNALLKAARNIARRQVAAATGDQDYDAVIKTTDIPNLFVLPCGPLPPNPAELLMSHRFEVVLAELAKRFDRIILDSPPLTIVTDAVVLSKQVDGAILVVRAEKTVRDDIKRSARQIRGVNGTIFGVIVNAIEPDSRSGYYYSYYGYAENSPEAQQPS